MGLLDILKGVIQTPPNQQAHYSSIGVGTWAPLTLTVTPMPRQLLSGGRSGSIINVGTTNLLLAKTDTPTPSDIITIGPQGVMPWQDDAPCWATANPSGQAYITPIQMPYVGGTGYLPSSTGLISVSSPIIIPAAASTSSQSITLNGVQVNDIILLQTQAVNGATVTGIVTSGTAGTGSWTKVGVIGSGQGNSEIWQATITTGGNLTATISFNTTDILITQGFDIRNTVQGIVSNPGPIVYNTNSFTVIQTPTQTNQLLIHFVNMPDITTNPSSPWSYSDLYDSYSSRSFCAAAWQVVTNTVSQNAVWTSGAAPSASLGLILQ